MEPTKNRDLRRYMRMDFIEKNDIKELANPGGGIKATVKY